MQNRKAGGHAVNPWEEIKLSDYENHMKLDSVMQLQAMNAMMKTQLSRYPVQTAMIMGIAGGNGLEHVNPQMLRKVYGVDINQAYLTACAARYPHLRGVLECVCADLTAENTVLPHVDLVIANLLIEYIGYECFQRALAAIRPPYVSCVIQINTDAGFVSDSPYLHAFDDLEQVHHRITEDELTPLMDRLGYLLITKETQAMPNSKALVQMDFKQKE